VPVALGLVTLVCLRLRVCFELAGHAPQREAICTTASRVSASLARRAPYEVTRGWLGKQPLSGVSVSGFMHRLLTV
jgi:hypothetical protein